jgi:hypothetical protein
MDDNSSLGIVCARDKHNPKEWILSGKKTYKHRHRIRDCGGEWDKEKRGWVFNRDPTDVIGLIKQDIESEIKKRERRAREKRDHKREMKELIEKSKDLIEARRAIFEKRHAAANYPRFWPQSGTCCFCLNNVFVTLDPDVYKDFILGCPTCHRSWDD